MTLTDHFAERLPQHGDITRAAAALGKSTAWGRKQYVAICEKLGPQAQ